MSSARETAASYFIEASAGTGKTTQLIDHVLRCVESGTSLSRIVAVTFTHAAAGDMKLRLREKLDQAGMSSAELELAFVGTIHSFCARLLRERPVEARVDPHFSELAEEEASGLFARVFRQWAEARLSEPNPTLRRALTRLTCEMMAMAVIPSILFEKPLGHSSNGVIIHALGAAVHWIVSLGSKPSLRKLNRLPR